MLPKVTDNFSDKQVETKDLHREFVVEWFERAIKNRKLQEDVRKQELKWGTAKQLNSATWCLGIFQITMIILYATVGGSQILPANAVGTVTQGYNMFIGVEIMMFIGFGYLMTFLKWYGLGAVGFTMLVTAVGLQWAVFTESFFAQILDTATSPWHYVDVNIYSLLSALYCISAILISFGALIGKISPFQLIVMTLFEIVFQSFNLRVLMMRALNVADIGGTYADHMFGAYFGLAVARVLGKPKRQPEMGNTPDLFSLIGTLFLWIYWPSFVAGAAVADSDQQQRALVNTILALSSSTVVAFITSSVCSADKRFRPVDIQNATLAGGVAIGCTANLTLSCLGAIMIGAAAGGWSVVGYSVIQPRLEEKPYEVHDTCGVHNLHAMPSVIGALASVFIAASRANTNSSIDASIYGSSYPQQWWRQLVGIIVCVSFAVISGTLTGYLLQYIEHDPSSYEKDIFDNSHSEEVTNSNANNEKEFHDNQWWVVADDYGRSFYSELALLLQTPTDRFPSKTDAGPTNYLTQIEEGKGGEGGEGGWNLRPGVHTLDDTSVRLQHAMKEWSSHEGRMRKPSTSTLGGLGGGERSWHGNAAIAGLGGGVNTVQSISDKMLHHFSHHSYSLGSLGQEQLSSHSTHSRKHTTVGTTGTAGAICINKDQSVALLGNGLKQQQAREADELSDDH